VISVKKKFVIPFELVGEENIVRNAGKIRKTGPKFIQRKPTFKG